MILPEPCGFDRDNTAPFEEPPCDAHGCLIVHDCEGNPIPTDPLLLSPEEYDAARGCLDDPNDPVWDEAWTLT